MVKTLQKDETSDQINEEINKERSQKNALDLKINQSVTKFACLAVALTLRSE